MKVLLLFHHYRTLKDRGGMRSLHIGSYLRQKGKEVIAIIPGVDPLSGKPHAGLKLGICVKEVIEGVSIFRVNCVAPRRSSRLSRFLHFSTSSCMQMLTSLFVEKCDIILCTSLPPSLLFVSFFLARLRKVPLIIDVRDLPLDYATETGYLGRNILTKSVMELERTVYRKAAAIVTISPGLKDILVRKGVAEGNVHVLPIGYDKHYYEKHVDWSRKISKELGLEGKFVVLYAGSMGHLSDIMTILKAAQWTVKNDEIVYVFAGDGERVEGAKRFVMKHGLHAHFIGEIPKADVILLCASADICVSALPDVSIYSTALGNKVFDYMGSGTPFVYCGPKGNTTHILNDSQGGLCLTAGDFKGLAKIITYLYQHPDYGRKMGEKGKRYIESRYLTDHIMERLDEIVSETIKTRLTQDK